jgi:hypothetical protein
MAARPDEAPFIKVDEVFMLRRLFRQQVIVSATTIVMDIEQ